MLAISQAAYNVLKVNFHDGYVNGKKKLVTSLSSTWFIAWSWLE